jgi:hypothetical protein
VKKNVDPVFNGDLGGLTVRCRPPSPADMRPNHLAYPSPRPTIRPACILLLATVRASCACTVCLSETSPATFWNGDSLARLAGPVQSQRSRIAGSSYEAKLRARQRHQIRLGWRAHHRVWHEQSRTGDAEAAPSPPRDRSLGRRVFAAAQWFPRAVVPSVLNQSVLTL